METTTRVWWVDLLRGLACLSMPFYHITYNLYAMGFTDIAYNTNLFWKTWQVTGMSTFILVSGLAFMLCSVNGVRWERLLTRAAKLGLFAATISLVTWFVMPEKFVRFGILHFFTVTILLAPLFRALGTINILLGIGVIIFSGWVGKAGLYPEGWLYITGIMSERPRSMDFVPLVPWFGVFLFGMGAGGFINREKQRRLPGAWTKPVIWLGQHSLSFYFVHQALLFAVFRLIKIVF